MNLKQKIWLKRFTAISCVVAPVTGIALGIYFAVRNNSSDYGASWVGPRTNLRTFRNEQKLNTNLTYEGDRSFREYSRNSYVEGPVNSLFLPLVRKITKDSDKHVLDNNGKVTLSARAATYLTFEGAESLKLFLNDGKVEVYDKSIDYFLDEVTGYFSEEPVKTGNSINNIGKFLADLSKTNAVEFTIRKGVRWIDSSGNLTNHNLSAMDYQMCIRDSFKYAGVSTSPMSIWKFL